MVAKIKTAKKNKPGNIYNAFVKQMFSQLYVFVDFMLNCADPQFINKIDLNKIQPAPTHYFGESGKERIADLVFRCPLKNGSKDKGDLMAVIVFEHQSSNLKEIPFKLLKIVSAIWEGEKKDGKKTLSAPYFLVLRTGKKPLRGTPPKLSASLPKGRDGKPVGKTVEVEYDIVDLPAWDFNKMVGVPVLRVVLGILSKMTSENPKDFPATLKPLLEITDERQLFESLKEIMEFVTKVFAADNQHLDEIKWNKILNPLFKGKEQAMIKSIFEEREAIGEARGKTEASREMVCTFLRGRFGDVPTNIENKILQINDPATLISLAAHAGGCATLEKFAEEL